MTSVGDPLARLVVDEDTVDRELLASLLEARVRLDLKSGAFAFKHGVRDRLSNRQEVVIALLAQKALHLLKKELPEGLRPQSIELVTGVKGGTLRPILKVLVDQRLVRQLPDRSYHVPGYALEDATRFLNEQGD